MQTEAYSDVSRDREVSASCDDGVSYTGSTPALGAGRLGSIPSTPTKKIAIMGDFKFNCIISTCLANHPSN